MQILRDNDYLEYTAVNMMGIIWPYRISDVIQDSAATGLGIEHLQAQVPIYCLSKCISDG